MSHLEPDLSVVNNGYIMEVMDYHGNTIALEYDLQDYEEAYSYAQHTSSLEGIDYVFLRGGDLDKGILFEDGHTVDYEGVFESVY